MSRESYGIAGIALLFATAVGLAVGSKLLKNEKKPGTAEQAEEQSGAKILQFKPRG